MGRVAVLLGFAPLSDSFLSVVIKKQIIVIQPVSLRPLLFPCLLIFFLHHLNPMEVSVRLAASARTPRQEMRAAGEKYTRKYFFLHIFKEVCGTHPKKIL